MGLKKSVTVSRPPTPLFYFYFPHNNDMRLNVTTHKIVDKENIYNLRFFLWNIHA